MKKYLLILAMFFMCAVNVNAVPIITIGSDTPFLSLGDNYWTMYYFPPVNPSPEDISAVVNGGGPLLLIYKQDVGVSGDTGPYASSYETAFQPPTDPGGATITWIEGTPYIEVDGVPAYLVVKDGKAEPTVYIFDLAALGWDGQETLTLSNFWPANGAISNVAIYDPPTAVPEPATMFLLGSSLIGLVGYGWKKFFKK
jgi:hypothetical protein